ncbi:acyl-CoA dehydrogenase family protein [Plantactinospora soyae]|uniref:Alkylation response protein AidB-like acyl-CoA dehydrogenase n=1 Tax=Plantactinospora soyae TaxID=1544732 RepID=A0A927RBS4_9ACTN|nr:acyl-CoA dehydrogenase family protein [Plantactinospora soyae]MBE1491986.1 alkylation response protein AidB-like acyl-CoA dehydrogenase [Plantactinospora soyae]
MSGYPAFALAERLDHGLGDPYDSGRPSSFARCVALDAREEFPAEICDELDRLGLPRWYVPAEFGGELRSYEELLHAVRILARRDLTVAIGHGKTYLGAVSAWVGASPEQARRVGAEVLAGSVISLALTEREHGSDLLAGEVSAVPTDTGYRVDGEKWLINNASRADLVCVLARTDPAGGTRGFSLLLVDKRRLAPGTYSCLPKERTHGVRGADISGIAFAGADVPAEAVLGAVGAGPEIVLKSVQLTRTMCAAMSLGLADQALRLVLDFASTHRLYDRYLVDLPHANRTLTEAYVDLLIGEATSVVTARGIHASPGELSVTSAIAKYLVPTMMDRTIPRLGQVLGARALLTSDHADGLFQKIERDHRIVGIFDGNTLVNLNTLVNQFPGLVRGYRRGLVDPGLEATTDLSRPLPDFDRDRLSLLSRTGCSVVARLPVAVAEIRVLADAGHAPTAVAEQAETLRRLVDRLHEQMAGYRPSPRQVPAEAFNLAGRYAVAFAAASCLQLWLANRHRLVGGPTAPLWADARWLRACLHRLIGQLRPLGTGTDGVDDVVADGVDGATGDGTDGDGDGTDGDGDGGAVYDRLLPDLRAQHREGRLFSLLPCRLADEAPRLPEETR